MSPALLPKPAAEGPEDDIHLSLRDHLMELRKRLKWAALFLVIGFCACYYWSIPIFHFLSFWAARSNIVVEPRADGMTVVYAMKTKR